MDDVVRQLRRKGALRAPTVEFAEPEVVEEKVSPHTPIQRRSSSSSAAGTQPLEKPEQRRRSASFSSFLDSLRPLEKDDVFEFRTGGDDFEYFDDEDFADEDGGQLIKQLLIRLSSIIVNAKRLRRRNTAENGTSAADKLLSCIKRTLAATYTRNIQGKLQDLILQWVQTGRPAVKAENADIDVDARLDARRNYWNSFQANTQKWERMGAGGAVTHDDDEDGEEDLRAALLYKFSSKSAVDSRKSGLAASRAKAANGTAAQRSYTVLSQLGKCDQGESIIDQCTEASEPTENSMIDLLATAVGTEKSYLASPARKQPARTTPLPARRATRQRASSAPSRRTQSHQASQGRYVFGAAQSKVVPKMHRARLCLAKPQVQPLQLEADPQQVETCEDAQLVSRRQRTLGPQAAMASSKVEAAWEKKRSSAKPAPFSSPHEEGDSAAIVQSGRWKYFKECQRLKLLPRMPAFLVSDAPEVDHSWTDDAMAGDCVHRFSLAGRCLLDRDLDAVGAPLQMLEAQAMTVDLSDNGFTDEGLAGFLSRLDAPDVRQLCLSRTGAKGMAIESTLLRMKRDWKWLRALQLAGCQVPGNMWASLSDALIDHQCLIKLDLSDTSLGRVSQQHVHHVSRMVSSAPYLQQLDLSGNYLLHSGFEAFAEAIRCNQSLKSLDLSYNACNAVVQPRRQQPLKSSADSSETLVQGPGGELYQDLPNFNPVALLCEALRDNTSMKDLRLASTFLDYSADCSLLLALLVNASLDFLDVSENPHGLEGLGALLRLMVHPDQNLVFCDITNFRDGTNGPGIVRLDFGALSGHYELELRHPQHRAVIRWLLRTAQSSGLRPPQAAFTNVSWSKPGQWSWAEERGWGVADAGRLSFDYALKVELQKEPTIGAALHTWHRTKRMPVTLGRFVPLLAMFNALSTNEQKIHFAKAMGDTLLFKMCHLQKLMQAAPNLSHVLAKFLYPRLIDHDQLLLFDLMDTHPNLARVFRREARSSFFFNDMNPTAHYVFHLDQLIDRTMAERLHVINHYDMLCAQALGGPDTSQYGNYEGVRNLNVSHNEGPRNLNASHKKCTSFVNFTIPDHGSLSLDYVSPRHVSASKSGRSSTNIFAGDLIDALDSSVCCQEDKVSAMYTISHHLVLTPEQMQKFCTIFTNPRVRSDAKKRVQQAFRSIKRRTSMQQIALGTRRKKSSAFMIRLENCRIEIFVMLFCRCNNQPAICTSEYLWNPNLFSPACSRTVRDRLGKIRTLDVLQCNRSYSHFAAEQTDDKVSGSGIFSSVTGEELPMSKSSTTRAELTMSKSSTMTELPVSKNSTTGSSRAELPLSQQRATTGTARASIIDAIGLTRGAAARQSLLNATGDRGVRPSLLGMGRGLVAAKAIQALQEMEVGRRYILDLSVHEDWVIARFILELTESEESTHLIKCAWSERKAVEDQGLDFAVPNGWFVQLPQEGVFSCTLVSQNEDGDADLRRELAIKILGWER